MAIVIFGIFVSLSYTLFGKTLQPQIVSLFEKSTEQTMVDLNKGSIKKLDNGIMLDSSGVTGPTEYIFDYENFKQGGRYKISFDMTLDEGNISYLGGHFHLSESSTVKVDGVKVYNNYDPLYNEVTWRYGFKFPKDFNVGETKHIELEFVADRYDFPGHSIKNIAIQPNRIYGGPYVKASNLTTLDNIQILTYK